MKIFKLRIIADKYFLAIHTDGVGISSTGIGGEIDAFKSSKHG